MAETATIEVPRLEGESARAYAARVRYVTMGPQRSIDKVGEQLGIKSVSGGRVSRLLEWSRRHEWVESARRYDEQVAFLTVQEASAQYRAELEAHRKDAMAYGKALCGVAVEMLAQLQRVSKSVEYTPAALATIARALTTGLDLRAHALDLDKLMPTLTGEAEDA